MLMTVRKWYVVLRDKKLLSGMHLTGSWSGRPWLALVTTVSIV